MCNAHSQSHDVLGRSVFHHLLYLSSLYHAIFTPVLCLLEEVDMWINQILHLTEKGSFKCSSLVLPQCDS